MESVLQNDKDSDSDHLTVKSTSFRIFPPAKRKSLADDQCFRRMREGADDYYQLHDKGETSSQKSRYAGSASNFSQSSKQTIANLKSEDATVDNFKDKFIRKGPTLSAAKLLLEKNANALIEVVQEYQNRADKFATLTSYMIRSLTLKSDKIKGAKILEDKSVFSPDEIIKNKTLVYRYLQAVRLNHH